MGGLVADSYVPVRSATDEFLTWIGEALTEMVQFQKEFKVFSSQHTLEMRPLSCSILRRLAMRIEGFFKFSEFTEEDRCVGRRQGQRS